MTQLSAKDNNRVSPSHLRAGMCPKGTLQGQSAPRDASNQGVSTEILRCDGNDAATCWRSVEYYARRGSNSSTERWYGIVKNGTE